LLTYLWCFTMHKSYSRCGYKWWRFVDEEYY
jgi:hypothetical protein